MLNNYRKSKANLLLLIFILIFLLQLLKNINNNNNDIFPFKNIDLSEIEKKLELSLEFIKIYSILFNAAKNGLAQSPNNSFINIGQNYKIHKKGVGICTIGRKENLYAKEF